MNRNSVVTVKNGAVPTNLWIGASIVRTDGVLVQDLPPIGPVSFLAGDQRQVVFNFVDTDYPTGTLNFVAGVWDSVPGPSAKNYDRKQLAFTVQGVSATIVDISIQ